MKCREVDDSPHYIYLLIDPRTEDCRYIGYTKDPKNRLRWHCEDRKSDSYRDRWAKKLKQLGLKPRMEIIGCAADVNQAKKIEMGLIPAARRLGWRITNANDGGDGQTGYVYTDARRQAVSRQFKGIKRKPFTAEHRAAIGASLTPEQRIAKGRKISLAKKGKKLSRKAKTALKAAMTPEVYARISVTLTGRKLTEEHKAKISAGYRRYLAADPQRASRKLSRAVRKARAEGRGRWI